MTSPGIGASGFIGIALETTYGVYVPPTKFFPIDSESLQYQQATQYRTPIRQTADAIGVVEGDVHTEGDLSLDALVDVVPYFLLCARTSVTKTGTAPGPFTYKFVPTADAVAKKSMSITLIRNGQVFGYTGVIVSSFTFTLDNEVLKFQPSLIGSDEDTETVPTPTWPTTVPFGAGMYKVEIPTASQVFDTDKFDFKVDDNGAPVFRLKDTGRGAQFVQYGERTVEIDVDRDFLDRTEYETYKALTARDVKFTATQGADAQIIYHTPATIIDTHSLNLGGQGDLVRASITYRGVLDDTTGESYDISVICQEDITVT